MCAGWLGCGVISFEGPGWLLAPTPPEFNCQPGSKRNKTVVRYKLKFGINSFIQLLKLQLYTLQDGCGVILFEGPGGLLAATPPEFNC